MATKRIPFSILLILGFVLPMASGAAQIDQVLEELHNPSEIVRLKAARTIREFGPGPDVVPALVESLRDDSPRVRSVAAGTLGWIGVDAAEAVADLMAALEDEDASVRSEAARALGNVGRPAVVAVPRLLRLLEHDRHAVGEAVIQALGAIGPDAQGAVPAVVQVLDDPDHSLRRTAAHEIHRFGEPARVAVPRLVEALRDPHTTVRQAAAWSLYEMGPGAKQAIPGLIETLNDLDNPYDVRGTAAYALGKMGPESRVAIPDLARALRAPHRQIRGAALWALSTIDPRPDITPEIANGLIDGFEAEHQDKQRTERLNHRPPQEVTALVEELTSNELASRVSAANGLRELGPQARDAAPALATMLSDTDERASRAAVEALVRIGSAGVPFLVEALDDRRKPVRLQAINGLGQLGERANVAVAALVNVVEDDEEELQKRALQVLSHMEGDPAITVPAARKALDDPKLRLTAMRLLGNIASGAATAPLFGTGGSTAAVAVPDLVPLVNHPDPDVQREAIRTLGQIGPRASDAAPDLIRAFHRGDTGVRSAALHALARMKLKSAEAAGVIVSALDDPEDRIRADAASALNQLRADVDAAIPALTRGLHDPHERTRQSAVWALGSMGAKASAAGPALIDVLRNDHQRVRAAAASALGRLGEQADFAIPPLMEALNDPYPGVRRAAAGALARLKALSALPVLRQVAGADYDADVREAAARAVHQMEEEDR